jgi:hypothetical protein
VVINALRERLERELRKEHSIEGLVEDVMEIGSPLRLATAA